jgi:hypothetical protein
MASQRKSSWPWWYRPVLQAGQFHHTEICGVVCMLIWCIKTHEGHRSFGSCVYDCMCVYVSLHLFGGGMWDTVFLWTTTRRLRGFDWGSPESYDSHRSSNLSMGNHNWYRQSSEHRSRFILGSWKCHEAPFNLGPMPFVAQFSVNYNDRSESPFLFLTWI